MKNQPDALRAERPVEILPYSHAWRLRGHHLVFRSSANAPDWELPAEETGREALGHCITAKHSDAAPLGEQRRWASKLAMLPNASFLGCAHD